MQQRRFAAWMAALAVSIVILSACALCMGQFHIAPGVVWAEICGRGEGSTNVHTVLFNIRIPRILLALLAGAGLSSAGAAFQSLFANPLATPDTLGVANGVTADNSNAVITMEQVYEWNPDMIVITNFTQTMPDDLYNNAVGSDDWSTVAAVQNHEVYKMPLGTYRTYTPGVDTPMTLQWLAKKAYPDLFADVDLAEEVRNYYNELYGITVTDEQMEAMYNPAKEAGSWK